MPRYDYAADVVRQVRDEFGDSGSACVMVGVIVTWMFHHVQPTDRALRPAGTYPEYPVEGGIR